MMFQVVEGHMRRIAALSSHRHSHQWRVVVFLEVYTRQRRWRKGDAPLSPVVYFTLRTRSKRDGCDLWLVGCDASGEGEVNWCRKPHHSKRAGPFHYDFV